MSEFNPYNYENKICLLPDDNNKVKQPKITIVPSPTFSYTSTNVAQSSPQITIIPSPNFVTSTPRSVNSLASPSFHPVSSIGTSQSSSISSTSSLNDDDETEDEIEIQQFNGFPRLKNKTILPDLEAYPFPYNVKIEANEIYKKLNISTKKSGRKNKLLFLCVYYAYTNLKLSFDPKQIADLLCMRNKDINKAFMLMHIAEYQPEDKFYKPIDFMQEYGTACHLNNDGIQGVMKLSEDIWNKGSDLNRLFPQVVAAGIIMYYLDIHGINYSPSIFVPLVKKAEATLIVMKNKVANVHNS